MTTDQPIVRVQNLVKEFDVPGSNWFRRATLTAINDVSFSISAGQTLGLVGESGSGKSTVANVVAGLLLPTSGVVEVGGVSLSALSAAQLRQERRNVQVVFQDPYTSLAPNSTVESSVREPLRAHGIGSSASRDALVDQLFDNVQLGPSLKARFPSEMSGGQLQRVSIARALALQPRLLVLDEPVSALDVSTKAEIINLLADLKDNLDLSFLFISHDLSTLRILADQVAVMYLGSIVEIGSADEIYEHPRHPYTQALLESVPVPDPVEQRARQRRVLTGDIPSPLAVPSGCPFHTRCPQAMPECATIVPPITVHSGVSVACYLFSPEAADDAGGFVRGSTDGQPKEST